MPRAGKGVMPTYYLHTGDDRTCATVQPTVYDARCEAAHYLGRLVCDNAEEFWDGGGSMFLAVSDHKGLILFTLEVFGHDAPVLDGTPDAPSRPKLPLPPA
jgi:hypothetical protein